jgi:hypothetical protein
MLLVRSFHIIITNPENAHQEALPATKVKREEGEAALAG